MPRTLEEDRQVCAANRDICHQPTEPVAECSSFPTTCQTTLAELDRCFVDMEQWYASVPTCENMTLDQMYPIGPTPESCSQPESSCQLTL